MAAHTRKAGGPFQAVLFDALRNDAAAEREAWLDAVTHDPLLPGRILPSDYLGQQA